MSLEWIEKRINDSYELPNRVRDLIPNPTVTVRTSTYQHAPYISECIEGVLRQKTTFPVEFIIGEDFSTDGTREKVFEYAKKYPRRIRVITADYNVGMKANGRRCVRAARGKYMATCEGDDYWTDPYKLQKQVDFLENHPGYGAVFTDADLLFEKTGKLVKSWDKTYKRKIPTGDVFDVLLYGNPYKTCTTLYKNEFATRYPYPFLKNDNFPMGDKIRWLHIAANSKIGYIPDSTTVYRVMEKSASRFESGEGYEYFARKSGELSRLFAEYYNHPFDEKKRDRITSKLVIEKCIKTGNYRYILKYADHPFIVAKLFIKEKIARKIFEAI